MQTRRYPYSWSPSAHFHLTNLLWRPDVATYFADLFIALLERRRLSLSDYLGELQASNTINQWLCSCVSSMVCCHSLTLLNTWLSYLPSAKPSRTKRVCQVHMTKIMCLFFMFMAFMDSQIICIKYTYIDHLLISAYIRMGAHFCETNQCFVVE